MNGALAKLLLGILLTASVGAGASGLRIAWITSTKVDLIQEDVKSSKQDHDSIVELKTRMRHVEEDVGEVKGDVKEILRRLPKPPGR